MPLEPVLTFDFIEDLADLARLAAQVAQCLPPHVSAALAYRCKAADAHALGERATSGTRDRTGAAKVGRRILELVSRFEQAVATTGGIPSPTVGNVTKIYNKVLGHDLPPKTQELIEETWTETAWACAPAPTGALAGLWQGANRACALAAIDTRCETLGLILLHGCFLQLRGDALPWSMAAPLITAPGPAPEPGARAVRDLLSSCRSELKHSEQFCRPRHLQRRLRDQAIRDCRVERVGPVIDAMFWRPSLRRGAVRTIAQVSDRTGRRDINVILETGWATAGSEKGPLVLAIPRTVQLVNSG
jgi:hypothetical protein